MGIMVSSAHIAPDSNPASTDGQSVQSERLTHLLAVAGNEFMAHGYQNVSVDGIARTSGVSKETIYRYFSDKTALFQAAIKYFRDAFSGRLVDLVDFRQAPDDVFLKCARAMYDGSVELGRLSPVWITVATATEFPDVARVLFDDGLQRLEPLRRYLAAHSPLPEPEPGAPDDFVTQFGALAVEGPRYFMGWSSLDMTERDVLAARVVRLFLHGYRGSRDHGPAPVPHRQPRAADLGTDSEALPSPQPVKDHISQLMQVAREEFYRRGYRGASLDEIGATARVGRGTLYRHFSNKAGLFEAVMIDAAQKVTASVTIRPKAAQSIEDNLLDIAMAASDALLSPECISLYRTVIAEAKRAPRLARQIYTQSRIGIMLPLTDYLDICVADGALAIDDCDWAAMQFLTLVTGGNRFLSTDPGPTEAERQCFAELAVSIFLDGFMGQADTVTTKL